MEKAEQEIAADRGRQICQRFSSGLNQKKKYIYILPWRHEKHLEREYGNRESGKGREREKGKEKRKRTRKKEGGRRDFFCNKKWQQEKESDEVMKNDSKRSKKRKKKRRGRRKSRRNKMKNLALWMGGFLFFFFFCFHPTNEKEGIHHPLFSFSHHHPSSSPLRLPFSAPGRTRPLTFWHVESQLGHSELQRFPLDYRYLSHCRSRESIIPILRHEGWRVHPNYLREVSF